MKKISSIFVLLCVITLNTTAQSKAKTGINQFADFSIGFGTNQATTSLSYVHNWQLGKKQKIEIGVGARLTNYFGSKKYYATAPAKLTTGKTGPGVFFSADIPANIDSVFFSKAQFNSLNISINLGYNITPKFYAGFNIDAIGFSFGGNKNGTYFANNGSTTATTAKPTTFNLLLVSDNDLGTLNSEFFGKYKLNSKWSAKLAYQFLFTEYKTTTKIQTTPSGDKNDRFRNKASLISIGASYNF
jgi:hypothetical protein